MSQESKIKTVGARKAMQLLTVDTLIKHAERIILTDKSAALLAQNSVSDLDAPSNDSRTSVEITALQDLCGGSGAVRVKSDDNDDVDTKVIQFSKPRNGS